MNRAINKLIYAVVLSSFFHPLYAQAKTIGLFTMVKGPVEVFYAPSSNADAPGRKVKFEDTYYKVRRAKVGKRLQFDQIIKTGPTSKAKITFINGDTMMVAAGTALNLSVFQGKLKKKTKKGQVLNLIYGKVRSVISKSGPRNNMQIKTKAAVAGVRGTDFFVSYNPSIDLSRVDVLRGRVEVREDEGAKPKMIKKGYSLSVDKTQKDKLNQLKLRPLTKSKLEEIENETSLKTDQAVLKSLPKTVQKQIQDIEEKSKQVILQDIKEEEPEKYKVLVAKSASLSVDDLNSSVLTDLKQKAPTESKVNKIEEGDLKRSLEEQSEAYEKYFQ
jgi:hypothetical protein